MSEITQSHIDERELEDVRAQINEYKDIIAGLEARKVTLMNNPEESAAKTAELANIDERITALAADLDACLRREGELMVSVYKNG